MPIQPQQLAQLHAQSERGDVAGALAGIETLLAGDQTNATAWHLAGILRGRAGNKEQGVDAFKRAIKLGLKTAEILNSLGLALQDLGRSSEAARQFAKAIKLDANYVPARVNAAKLKAAEGRANVAEQDLRATLRAHPDSALAQNALASVLEDQGQAQAALDIYAGALVRNPKDLAAAIRLGKGLRDMGRAQEALDHYRTHQQAFASSPEFVEAMGGAMVDCGQIAEAEQVYEHLVARAPGYFAGHRALARLAREYATGKDAYRSYRAMVSRWPQELSIWQDWLSLMLAYRDHDEALEVVREAESKLGANPMLSYSKALALTETGANDEAEKLFAVLAPGAGGSASFLVSRARNAIARGEVAAAEEWLTQATETDPHNQSAWAYLGLAWRLRGDAREFWLHDYDVQTRQMPIEYLSDPDKMQDLRQLLRGMHTSQNHPPEQSLRGGTQTQGALFARPDPEIVALREAIRLQVDEFARSLPDDAKHPFYRRKTKRTRFTGSWSVRLRGEGFHTVHLHQEGWISSALHLVQPPAEEGGNPDAGCLTLGMPPREMGLDLPARKIVRPIEGSLVLFPSSMWHGTIPFTGGDERLTVAFDAVPA